VLITVTSPTTSTFLQRSGTTASIAITGSVGGGTHDIEARYTLNGATPGSYTTIAAAATGTYSGTLSSQSQGTGTLEVRWAGNTSGNVFAVPNVNIGDIFAVIGQSNAVGQGSNIQSFVGNGFDSALQISILNLGGGLFGNDYVWHPLVDPTDSNVNQVDTVSLDTVYNGSIWPLVARFISAKTGAPVAFVAGALGATSISQWQPAASPTDRTTLFGSQTYRCNTIGGVRGMVIWQGETDAINGMSTSTYASYLTTSVDSWHTNVTGSPKTCVTLLETIVGGPSASNQANIRAGQLQVITNDTNAIRCGDLINLVGDDSSGHVTTNFGLAQAAAQEAAAMITGFGL
jgi:hypothetical protein